MLCLIPETSDPCLNLAFEEVLLKESDKEYLILSINDPSVIIGKHQAAHMEADTGFVTRNKIPVIRRISGGGTVFHDRGNLNFTFISNSETGKQVDFRKYTRPVIDFLVFSGVDAVFSDKSDICVNGYKISGNAEHVYRKRVLHHGTILFCSDLFVLENSIRRDKSSYSTRAVLSRPASVMNLKTRLPEITGTEQFREKLRIFLAGSMPETEMSSIEDSYIKSAVELAEKKYKTWEWNYAYGPDYQFNRSFLFEHIRNHCYMSVHEGIISECVIEGSRTLSALAGKIRGCRHMPNEICNLLEEEKIPFDIDLIYNFF